MSYQKKRRLRHHHRRVWNEINRKRKHPESEANLIIDFARRWAPYGGAPKEEIFINFGMTTHNFIKRLWQVIPESSCTQEEIRDLASAYPNHIFTVWS
ncbi:hypothetical protein P3H15_39905 [Rhodococcus sp. T2V]|uniref:hypothetical protein n=1 Tax=Rhodococcus sp. T2V TaxID=3034164 RepID=UPI0023E11982|nr:hypothetical protein [Rhodococcus sp. T2V]MDF3311164.1 hypothetical protein [Rhodococcus sp. T2V]